MKKRVKKYPIKHWSYSSLVSYLRNPLAWHKRYVEGVYDIPGTPASSIGRSAHMALQHFYGGVAKAEAIEIGLAYLRNIPDFEINLGKAETKEEKKEKREKMEKEYLQAISFYLKKPPKHNIVGIEFMGMAFIPGIVIPVKAISDLVVVSETDDEYLDIIDHKFVENFGSLDISNPLFMVQALFNYYTVISNFHKPVARFIVYECRKRKNKDGKPQLRRHIIDFREHEEEFYLFHRLLQDATTEIAARKIFLPNPSDMFEGKDSLELYRQDILDRSLS
jgi:hypothetical protein